MDPGTRETATAGAAPRGATASAAPGGAAAVHGAMMTVGAAPRQDPMAAAVLVAVPGEEVGEAGLGADEGDHAADARSNDVGRDHEVAALGERAIGPDEGRKVGGQTWVVCAGESEIERTALEDCQPSLVSCVGSSRSVRTR